MDKSVSKENKKEKIKIFGENLRVIRGEMGLTAHKFGMLLGVSPAYVGLIERGERSPSFELMLRILELAGGDFYDMLTPLNVRRSKSKKPQTELETKQATVIRIIKSLDSDELDFARASLMSLKSLNRGKRKSDGNVDVEIM